MSQPVFISVEGTAISDPFGPGFSGDIGRALSDSWNTVMASFWGEEFLNKWFWQPIGYPAATFPMTPSVEAGRAEVNRQIGLRPRGTKVALSGYSQGALVVNEVWAYDILDPNGIHHDRLGDVVGIINFGDPMRCPGVANGNKIAGLPMPTKLNGVTTGGIAGAACLTREQTPDFLLSCALDGDLYACAPVGDDPWGKQAPVGKVENYIYKFVESGKVLDFFKIGLSLFHPIGTVKAIWNGIKFAAKGPQAPHWQYQGFVSPMVDWLLAQV